MESKTPRIFLDVTKHQGNPSGIYIELLTEEISDPKIIKHPASKNN